MSASTGQSRSNSRSGTASSRRVISRSGRKSRLSQLSSSVSKARESAFSTGSPLSDSDYRGQSSADLNDFGGTDIYNEDGWDTDLEEEHIKDEKKSFKEEPSRLVYLESCKANGVIPASYFLRHLQDSSLDMRHHGLGPAGMKPLAVALTSNTFVIELNLMDNWLEQDGGRYVGDMLKDNCYITHVDLSDNQLDEDFAQQFTKVVAGNNTLTHVNLSGNKFGDKAAEFFAEALTSTTKIEQLNLSKNRFGDKSGVVLGPAIAENSSLRVLDLSWNNLRRKGAVAVAQGVKQNVLLQVLDLSWNGFALEGAKALGDALKVNSSIERLDISSNRFTAEAAVLFSKCLVVNESLKVLKMGKNPMESAGCYGIVAAIMRNPNTTMQELDFSDVHVNTDFNQLREKLRIQLPGLRLHHGGDAVPMKPRIELPPVIKLCNYIERHNVRLIDVFSVADPDRRMRVSRSQFVEGVRSTGIKMSDGELQQVMDDLNADGSGGEVNYNDLILGRAELEMKSSKSHPSVNESDRLWRK